MADLKEKTYVEDVDRSVYDIRDEEHDAYRMESGLTPEIVEKLSKEKDDPAWMQQFRLESLQIYNEMKIPDWGPSIEGLDMDHIATYVRPNTKMRNDWKDVPEDIKETFERLGIPQAERKSLAGVGAQYDSELVYHNVKDSVAAEGVVYTDMESALKGGATCVQLREKQLGDAEFLQEAIQIHGLCQQYGVPLFINDNVDVAVKCHAEGIHVGQDDMAAAQVRQRVGEDMMIGVSAHTVQEALDAVAHGADCLGVGAAFATHTKEDVNVLPRQTLIDICNAVDVPVVAIGGIHKDNILQLRGTGVDGVALVSAIFGAKDIEAECRELKALSEQIVE